MSPTPMKGGLAKRQSLYRSGKSDSEIARAVGAHSSAITMWRNRSGLAPNRRPGGSPEHIVKRFWKYVVKRDGCWRWTGATNSWGYGWLLTTPYRGKKKMVRAHRLSYLLAYGELRDASLVLHKCDNPPCTNPDHLYLGTHADNSQDAKKRGRVARGTRSGSAKLTEADIHSIRLLVASGRSRSSVARKFSISPSQASRIADRKRWGWLESTNQAEQEVNQE